MLTRAPLLTVARPTLLLNGCVNQSAPSGPRAISCPEARRSAGGGGALGGGQLVVHAGGAGIGKSAIAPVGVTLPSRPSPVTNQTLPSGPRVRPNGLPGELSLGTGYSVIAPLIAARAVVVKEVP